MKRSIRNVTASSDVSASKCMLAPDDVLSLLLEIDELSGVNILLKENSKGESQFVIGDSTYTIEGTSPMEAVQVYS